MPGDTTNILQKWRTNQTIVAAFMLYSEENFLGVEWDSDECSFVFEKSPSLLKLLAHFVSGESVVEPVKFNAAFGRLKRAMFDHPDAPTRQRSA